MVGLVNLRGLLSLAAKWPQLCYYTSAPQVFQGLHDRVLSSPHLEVPHTKHQITNSHHTKRADAIPADHTCHSTVICAVLRC